MLNDLSDTPRHPIRDACARAGVAPGTLRAWERRYGLLTPGRSRGNYRLYSDRDVAVLCWVKERLDAGMPIRMAAAEVDAMRRTGRWPAAPPLPSGAARLRAEASAALARRLYTALVGRNEARAADVLRAALAAHGPEGLILDVLHPCLVAIGEAWRRGEIGIAGEHFASQYIRSYLAALFLAAPTRPRAPRIIVGCAPRERHDIGALMLAFLLRRSGYRVEFLGADVDVADLVAYARTAQPALVCLSANAESTALALADVEDRLQALSPAPRLGFGGAAFERWPVLRARVPGCYLGGDPVSATARVRALLSAEPAG